MDAGRAEWVEIIEPRTKEHMYANLATGECVWDPPPGVNVKKTDDNQWWELFDSNTSRFYYYNAINQKTVWHKPQNCDIIPLAKLQTLKQNTEVADGGHIMKKESIGTQTATKICSRNILNSGKLQSCASTQTSPPTSPLEHRKHYRHHKRESRYHKQPSLTPTSPIYPPDCVINMDSMSQSAPSSHQHFFQKSDGSLPGYANTQTVRSHDSGRSSDSSSVSQSHSSLDGANYISQRKLESCSTESIGSTHSPTRSMLKETHGHYSQRSFKSVAPSIEFNGVSYASHHPTVKPVFRDLGPVRQHSFEPQRAPPVVTPRQYSMDSSMETRSGSQFWIPSRIRNRSNTTISASVGKSTPQTHRKHHLEDYPPTQRELYANAAPFYLDNSVGYFPESVCTPLSSRRQWLRKSTPMDSMGSSHHISLESSRLMGSSDGGIMLSAEYPTPRHGRTSSDLSPHSLDLSLHDLDGHLLSQQRGTLDSQHKCVSELAILSPRLLRNVPKRPHHDREPLYDNRDQPDVTLTSRYRDYNSGYVKNETCINQNEAPVPLYSNIDYPSPWECQTDNHTYLLPLQHYLLEQAKLSGCKLADIMSDDKDSFSQSDEDSEGPRDDDDDDFADDEGMSHQDSSSQEYLDNYRFFDEEYDEDSFYAPISVSSKQRTKSSQKLSESVLHSSNHRECDPAYTSSPIFSPRASHPLSFSSSQYASSCCRKTDINLSSPTMEKSQSFQPDMKQGYNMRPFSSIDAHETNGLDIIEHLNGSHDQEDKKSHIKGDIEKYAEDNLNRHKKGIFRKKFTIQDMLSWSKDPIRKPMIMTTDKSLKRDACEIFKLIQIYMLDHKTKSGQTYEVVILDIATRGWSKPPLRDELYIQICRQTTDNPKQESLVLGWELMAVCLTFFPPSLKFQPYLGGYINRHRDTVFDTTDLKISHYAMICGKRLERIAHKGAARSLRKPNIEEIEQSRIQIFRPSMFGSTLKEVMALQKARYPGRSLPWIQTTLSEAVLQLNGAQTEGIFRVPGDIDEVNCLKIKIDQWEIVECSDPHVPASLIKQWYRELFEPLIPDEYYDDCILYCNEPESAIHIVQKLPEINRLVFSYLIRFLQVFAAEENCAMTKMDANNLAMVMAPNCLRCMAEDPRVMFENTRKEMAFIKTLIQHLDTGYMEGIL